MLDLEFSGEPEEKQSKSLPEGEYLMAPVFFSIRESRNGNNYLAVDLTVMAGEHAGKSLYGQTFSLTKSAQWRISSFMQTLSTDRLKVKSQADFFKGRFGCLIVCTVKEGARYNNPEKKELQLTDWRVPVESDMDEMRTTWKVKGVVEEIQNEVKERFKSNNKYSTKNNLSTSDFSRQTLSSEEFEKFPKYAQLIIPEYPIGVACDVEFTEDIDEDVPF